jgi:hypothetical protein
MPACCKGAKKPCGLKLCPVRPSEAALGHPRAHPSKRGRDKREQAYAKAVLFCEDCGAWTGVGGEVDHVEGRGLGGHNRTKSPLRKRCWRCHKTKHEERVA